MAGEMTDREYLIRLDGKIDAYASGQGVRLDNIDKRLDRHDVEIDNLRVKPVGGWKVAGVVAGVVAVVVAGGGGVVSLIQAITGG